MDSRHDYVDYNGVRVDFTHGTAREWDEYMSDDSGFDFYNHQAHDDAMNRAKAQYEQQENQRRAAEDANRRAREAEQRAKAAEQAANDRARQEQQQREAEKQRQLAAERAAANARQHESEQAAKQEQKQQNASHYDQAKNTVNSSSQVPNYGFDIGGVTPGDSQVTNGSGSDQGNNLPSGMTYQDPQKFADQYKLDLIASGSLNSPGAKTDFLNNKQEQSDSSGSSTTIDPVKATSEQMEGKEPTENSAGNGNEFNIAKNQYSSDKYKTTSFEKDKFSEKDKYGYQFGGY